MFDIEIVLLGKMVGKFLLSLCMVTILCGCQFQDGEIAEVRIKSLNEGLLTFGFAPNLDGEAPHQEFYCNVETQADYGFVNRQHGVRYSASIRKHSNGSLISCVLSEQSKQKLHAALEEYRDKTSFEMKCDTKTGLSISDAEKLEESMATVEEVEVITLKTTYRDKVN